MATKKKASPKKKAAAKKAPAKRAAPATKGRANKKAEVIAMMKRSNGATLAAIMEHTGWLPHTVRGLVSVLRSKGGLAIASAKNESGERVYSIGK